MAEEYERVRSGYSAALVDKAVTTARLEPGDPVVEIGPGTGKLTRELVERRLVVDAVEPDQDLAAMARRIVGDAPVRFHVATFEAVDLPEGAFKAVFAATSYHWVDPDVGWTKVARLLEPDGTFALLSHAGGKTGPIDDEVVDVWRQVRAPSYFEPIADDALWAGVDERAGNVSELWAWLTRHPELARPEAATLFRDVELTREPIERTFSVEDYLARIRTTNGYLHLSAADQQQLERGLTSVIEAHGGTYLARHSAVLVTARRA